MNARVALYGGPQTAESLTEAGAAVVRFANLATAIRLGWPFESWTVTNWLRRCDCCGHEQPWTIAPRGWTNDGRYDLCERCALEAAR